MTSRVFVTQQPKPNGRNWTPNLTPAAQYGGIHYVFSANAKPFCDADMALKIAERVLTDFNPARDFVLWPNTGDPIAAWAVMIALARKGLDKIRILNWERKLVNGSRSSSEGFYTPITFTLTQ
jgi:hypothetical protein